jgi:hypothetical protein
LYKQIFTISGSNADSEFSLHVRLVEAGEGLSGVRSFEVGHSQVPGKVGGLVEVTGAVEPVEDFTDK